MEIFRSREPVSEAEFIIFLADTLREINVPLNYDMISGLRDAYFEPHRVYHDARHIMDFVNYLRSVKTHFNKPTVTDEEQILTFQLAILAALFHDYVYDTWDADTYNSNEMLSALEAVEQLRTIGISEHDCGVVQAAIWLTKPFIERESQLTENTLLFLDGDNLWLTSEEAFADAEERVIEEWCHEQSDDGPDSLRFSKVVKGREQFYQDFYTFTNGTPFLAEVNKPLNVVAKRLLEQAVETQ